MKLSTRLILAMVVVVMVATATPALLINRQLQTAALPSEQAARLAAELQRTSVLATAGATACAAALAFAAARAIIADDQTSRREAELQRDRYEQRFRATVEAAPTAIVMINSRGEIELVNAATEEMFGYQRSELISQPVESLVPERFRAEHELLRRGYAARPEARQMGAGRDLYGRRRDGTEVPVSIGLSPIEMEDEAFVLATIADISARKEAEVKLRTLNESLETRVAERTLELRMALDDLTEAKDAAEAANQAKSVFLANMSHEIRSPLHAVIGAADMLLDSELAPRQREFLDIVRGSSESLLAVINDILDFSKIEADQLAIECIPFDHEDALWSCMSTQRVGAEAKRVELTCKIAPDVPQRLKGDPHRLRQVITNLLDNAVKFTEDGDVRVSVRVKSREDDAIVLEYEVVDTGVGIPPGKLGSIFEAFEQADASTTRRFGGSGLGLAISSRLVRMMGGAIAVESTEGGGATFRFTARFATVGEGEALALEHSFLRGMCALAVCADDAQRRRVVATLGECGMHATAVASAGEAIEHLRVSLRSGPPCVLVIIDSRLPDSDGFELAKRVQRLLGRSAVRIVMISGANDPHDISRCLDLKLGGLLTTPVDQAELLETIDTIFEHDPVRPAHARQQDAPAPATTEGSFLHVLVAEDSPANQLLVQELLAKHGLRVDLAANGVEAIEWWLDQRHDLVLMDVQMPDVDGLEATRRIRKTEAAEGGHTKIIALTAHSLEGDRERCLNAGADAYLAKPFRPAELLDAIEAVCGVSLDRSLFAEDDNHAPSDGNPRKPRQSVNWRNALELAHGDQDVLRRLADICVRETDDLLAQLAEAVDREDAALAQQCAHTLKSHFRVFDFAVADHVAFHIENTARDGSVDIRPELDRLRSEADRMQSELIDFIEGRIQLPETDQAEEP